MRIVVDRRLLRDLGIKVAALECSGNFYRHPRVDVKISLMKAVNDSFDYLKIIRPKRHPLLSAYRAIARKVANSERARSLPEKLAYKLLIKKRISSEDPLTDIAKIIMLKTFIPLLVFDINELVEPLIVRYTLRGEIAGLNQACRFRGFEPVISDANSIYHLIPVKDCKTRALSKSLHQILLLTYGVRGISEIHIARSIAIARSLLIHYYPYTQCKQLKAEIS